MDQSTVLVLCAIGVGLLMLGSYVRRRNLQPPDPRRRSSATGDFHSRGSGPPAP